MRGSKDNDSAIIYNRMMVLESFVTMLSFYPYCDDPVNYFACFISSYEKRVPGICQMVCKSLINSTFNYQENGILPYSGRIGTDQIRLRVCSASALVAGILLTREHQIENLSQIYRKDFKLFQIEHHIESLAKEDKQLDQ